MGLLAGLAVVLGGCLAEPDRRDESPPVDAASDVGARDAEAPSCVDDAFGAGLPELPAARLAPGTYPDLVVCPGQTDWFAVRADVGETLQIALTAPDGLRLRALDGADRIVGEGPALRVDVPPGGLRLAVGPAPAGVSVTYALRLALASAEVCRDAADPGDRPEAAAALDASGFSGSACDDDVDWFALDAQPGTAVSVQVVHLAGDPLSAALFEPASPPIRGPSAEVAGGRTTLARVVSPRGRLLVRIAPGLPAAAVRYALQVRLVTPERPTSGLLSGRLDAWDRPVTAEGLAAPRAFGAEGLVLDVLTADGALLGATRTGADGRFTLAYVLPRPAGVELRAVAEVARGAMVARVGPGPDDDLPWAVPVHDAPPEGADDLALALDPEDPVTAAIHVASVGADGLARIAPLLPAAGTAPPAVYFWRPDAASGCGTCFLLTPFPHVELSGSVLDPDEWDDPVILHELGHHIAWAYSRDDSPGGRHDGRRTTPALAWSEGLATFHASWQQADPVQLDVKVTGVRQLALEAMDDERAFGTADGTPAGDVSEYLVAALLWDLHDGGAMDDDEVSLSDELLFGPLFGPLRALARDNGAPGVDLLDYLDALACALEPADVVVGAAEDRAFPFTPPETCRGKEAPPFQMERVGDQLQVRALVAGRLVIDDGRGRLDRAVSAGERVVWAPSAGARYIGVTLEHGRQRAHEAFAWRGPEKSRAPIRLRRRAGAWELDDATR